MLFYEETPVRKMAWTEKAGVRDVLFLDDEVKSGKYNLPRLLFSQVDDDLYVYAIVDNQVYRCPLPNLTGAMCWGNIKDDVANCSCKTFEEHIEHVGKIFWKTNFTHGSPIQGGITYPELMANLVNTKDPFPKDCLIPLNKTVDEILSKVYNTDLSTEFD